MNEEENMHGPAVIIPGAIPVDLTKLSEPLTTDQIDFRVQSINKGGYCTVLAYKNARVDMQRLDEVVGPMGWKREHTRDNHNCIVSLWDGSQWVGKEDTGSESMAEAEKGLASDSFKRACFNWGIGRELYDYPAISVKLFPNEYSGTKQTWELKLKEWKWASQFADGKLAFLAAKSWDQKQNKFIIRFQYGEFTK